MVSGPSLLIEDLDQEEDYLMSKWTFKEYIDLLERPIDYPNPNNKDDPGYYRKYAHNVPPPEAYFYVPSNRDKVATGSKTKMVRRIHFGWDNLTEFEVNGIKALK